MFKIFPLAHTLYPSVSDTLETGDMFSIDMLIEVTTRYIYCSISIRDIKKQHQ